MRRQLLVALPSLLFLFTFSSFEVSLSSRAFVMFLLRLLSSSTSEDQAFSWHFSRTRVAFTSCRSSMWRTRPTLSRHRIGVPLLGNPRKVTKCCRYNASVQVPHAPLYSHSGDDVVIMPASVVPRSFSLYIVSLVVCIPAVVTCRRDAMVAWSMVYQ